MHYVVINSYLAYSNMNLTSEKIMSAVFVLTDKGWKDQEAVTLNHSVYCYDVRTSNMDLCKVTSIKDVSDHQTFYLYNRDINYGTYCNGASAMALYNGYQGISYDANIGDVKDRYMEYDILLPCHLDGLSTNIRSNYFDPQQYSRFEKDVKLRSVGLFHFEIDTAASLSFLDQWKNRYQRLNAADYNQAMMLQMILLKGGYLSRITQDIGFDVVPLEKESVVITNVDVSKRTQITQTFFNNEQQLHPICNISGDVVVC